MEMIWMRKVAINLRYKCEQCGLFFNEDGGEVDQTFLDHSPMFVYRYYNNEMIHTCYGHVPGGEQRFFGLAKLVGWSYRLCDLK